ncbi:MAG: metal-dependent hydrolase [Candidatus Magasanikbacteria bacterium]|nr:metal-dependent hydrolase [Candidatus Magasanikbacteria bacterium]MCA9390780.1 metal-dependent hydrolase [Candidatus Magasanikbacteria bacterium]
MQWHTHAAIGANAIWLTALFGDASQAPIVYLTIGAFGGLLPDIDAGGGKSYGAKIHYIGGGIFKPFQNVFRHRGFFHSFMCIVLVFCLSTPLAWFIDPFVPMVLTAGYASHIVIDNWNCGLEFFYPLKKRVTFVPKWMQFRVGSIGDNLLFLLGVFGLVAYILTHLPYIAT